LLGLSGRLSDGSNESIRFRENIESPNIRLPELKDWTVEALSGPPDEQHMFALQDIVNSLGTRLGFQVEYGAYQPGNARWMPFDGLWRLTEGLYLGVEVFSDPLERIDFSRLKHDLDSLARNPVIAQAETVACFILCQGSSPSIAQQIRSSSLHGRIRLLPLETLFDLLRMDLEGILSRRQLSVLLRPFDPVGVHDVLGFLEDFIDAYKLAPEAAGEPSAPAPSPIPLPSPGPPSLVPVPRQLSLEEILVGYQADEPERARSLLDSYLSEHPEDALAWETSGNWALEAGDLEAAQRAFQASLARDNSRRTPTLGLASIYRKQGDLQAALTVLDQAGGLQAPYPILVERSLVLLEAQDFQEAEQTAQVAHAASGGAEALCLLGRARQGMQDHDGAVAALKMAREQDPDSTEIESLLQRSLQELSLQEALPPTGS
jgi:hypothetical protein